jgi:hypothetical protein
MLQHIDADQRIKAGDVVGQALAHTHIIPDAKATLAGMGACGVDCLGGGVDSGDMRTAQRQRFGHESPGAAQIQHHFALPVYLSVEPAQAPGHKVLQRADPVDVIRPPAIGDRVVDREVIAHRAAPSADEEACRARPPDTA